MNIYRAVPTGSECTAIVYDGTNFLELKRHIGIRIERSNKFVLGGPLLLDTPYGVQRVDVGNVVIHQDGYWRAIERRDFNSRYEILR